METTIEAKILKAMFGDDSRRFVGFFGIVDKLVETGECLSTDTVRNINFAMATCFISIDPYPEGYQLVKITFDRESAMKTKEFFNRLQEMGKSTSAKIAELNEKKQKLDKEMETIVKMLTSNAINNI
jgi:hypothetical protein